MTPADLKPADIGWLTARLAQIAADRYPTLTTDAMRIQIELTSRISGALNYRRRIGESFLLAQTQDIPFAKKRMSMVNLIDVRHPGHGLALWRDYRRWLEDMPAIRLAIYTPLGCYHPALNYLLHKLGFQHRGDSFEWTR